MPSTPSLNGKFKGIFTPKRYKNLGQFQLLPVCILPLSNLLKKTFVALTGILPQRCWVVIVTEEEFLGTLLKHRLNFRHHSLAHISVIKNGETFPFRQGYNPSFDKEQYSDCYFALLHERGGSVNNFDIPIAYDEYDSGYTIYVSLI